MTLACSMLYVRDFPGMRDFYRNMLQAEPVNTEWGESWALFDLGGTALALHAIPGEHAANGNARPAKRETSPVKLIFAVEDVPAELARLELLGAAAARQPWQQSAESCDCIDPEGNVFQIAALARVPQLFGRP